MTNNRKKTPDALTVDYRKSVPHWVIDFYVENGSYGWT